MSKGKQVTKAISQRIVLFGLSFAESEVKLNPDISMN